MKNLHKLIILVILSVLSVSNVFGTNEYENCENNLGIEKYSNLNKTLYDKVTSLGSKLVAKYSTSSETVRLENINKIFSLISNLKKITKLNESQTQIIDLLGYHISCEMKKIGNGISKTNNKYLIPDKAEIQKGETITFRAAVNLTEFAKLGYNSNCRIKDLTWNSLEGLNTRDYLIDSGFLTASPQITTTYELMCQNRLTYVFETIEKITVLVSDSQGTQNVKKTDETWDYGFYVIYENNDYDNDGKAEGCNEAGLSYPDTLCILKLGDMYISPKNFTMKYNFAMKNETSGDGTHTYSTQSYDKVSAGLVNKQTFINKEVYMNGLVGYGLKNVNDWYNSCSKGAYGCDIYESELSKVPINSFDYDASSCKELFNFKVSNSEIKALGNKRWEDLTELGGDGLNSICSKDGSDTQGLCALQLNKSKLRLYTSGIYYGYNGGSGNFLGISNHYYGGTIVQSTANNTARFLTFGGIERYKPEVSGIPSRYNLNIEGQDVNLSSLELYTRCVGY